MAKINFDGNEWDLDYFIASTEFLENNLGEDPSRERVERVERRKKAIEDHLNPKPKKKKTTKKTKELESVPDNLED